MTDLVSAADAAAILRRRRFGPHRRAASLLHRATGRRAVPALAGSHRQTERSLDQLCINTIRTLSMDAVQQANSGHPGTPMALAPVIFTLWQRFLRFDPDDPIWPNRDRFVLSNGHASMLLYAMLHLTGTKAVNAEYARLDRPRSASTTSSASASWTAIVRATPNIV